MPYNIKGETPAIIKKMESCVNSLVSDGNFKPLKGRTKKSSAIAICKAGIQKWMKKRKKK